MIETTRFPLAVAMVLHRVAGSVDQAEAERGAAEALAFVQELFLTNRSLKLVLDLRGMHFVTLQAHRAWSQGFARHPALQDLVHAVAIICYLVETADSYRVATLDRRLASISYHHKQRAG